MFQTTDAAGHTGVSVAWWTTQGHQVVTEIVAPGDAQAGGSAPTISPDGKTVVFVRADADGAKQLFAATKTGDAAWGAATQLTTSAGDKTGPIFESDNATVAYQTSNGTYQIGAAGGTETRISDLVGGLAVRTDSRAFVHRLGGSDRFETATKVSQMAFRNKGDAADHRGQAKAVVLTRSDQFADALGGAALASHLDAPLLLTEPASLNGWSRQEIQRVLPAGGTVYVLGGDKAITPNVVKQLTGLGYKVQRIGGADRFATAVDMAGVYAPNADQVLVATGMNFPDALSAGAAAANFSNMAVVLTDDAKMPEATYQYLVAKSRNDSLDYLGAVGGQAAKALRTVSNGQFDDMHGADRYATSYSVASHLWSGFTAVGIATGANWPDSLAGGALMGLTGGPLVLVDPAIGLTLQEYKLFDANRGSDNFGYVFGGDAALPSRIDNQLAAAIDTATGSSHDTGFKTQARLSTPSLSIH
ncbi:cell wall-binding repeat-containing protein [Catenulispora yoronensis]